MRTVSPRPLTAREFLAAAQAAIRDRVLLVIAIAVLVPGLATVYNAVTPSATARVELAFNPVNIVQAVFNEPRTGVPPPTASELASDSVLEELGRRTGLTLEEVRDRVSVEQTGNEREAVLVARGDDPDDADTLVNEWATVYLGFRATALDGALDGAEREIDERIDELAEEGTVFQRREILRSSLAVAAARREIVPDVALVGFRGADANAPPTVFLLLLGLGLGAALAIVLAVLDGRVRTAAMARSLTGLPLLARFGPPSSRSELTRPAAAVRSHLYLRSGTSRPGLLLLAGTGDEEATALPATAVAEDIARDGGPVALVLDGDRPGGANLSPVVNGSEPLPDAMPDGVTTLAAAVPVTCSPERWAAVLEGLSERCQSVVLATPDWRAASALAGLARADASLLMVTAGVTRASELVDGVEADGSLPSSAVGLIFVDAASHPAPEPENAVLDGEAEDAASSPPPARPRRWWRPRRRNRSRAPSVSGG